MKRLMGLLLTIALLTGLMSSVAALAENSKDALGSAVDAVAWPRTVEDDLGHSVALEKKPERVVALYQGSIETLFALGTPPVGAGDADAAMGGYAPLKQHAGEIEIVDIGSSRSPRVERILELAPDLIIGTAVHSDAYDALNKIAPTVLFSWDSWKDPLNKYAKCLGAEEAAEQYIAEVEALTADAREKLSAYKDKTFFAGWDLGKNMFAPFGLSYQLFYDSEEGLGLAAPAGYPESYEQISIEALAEYDPEYIFVIGRLGSQETNYEQNYLEEDTEHSAIWQSLKAVKSGNVYFLDVSTVAGSLGRKLARALPMDVKKTPAPTFNLIGSCADLFRFQADARELIRIMDGAFGMKPLCVLTSDTSIQEIERMGGAHINLVIRREGEGAAKHLQKRFGTPYLVNRPYGMEGTARWIDAAAHTLGILPNQCFVEGERKESEELLANITPMLRHLLRDHADEIPLSIGAHADVARGILDFGCGELCLPKGDCWCDCPDMHSDKIPYFHEEQWIQAIQARKKGLLMASGEALEWANRNRMLQISNPDRRRRLNPYDPPFVGFRGAIHLMDLWFNAMLDQEDEDD